MSREVGCISMVGSYLSLKLPASTSVYASTATLAGNSARLEAKMESLLLSCGALSSPTMCRFSPAFSVPPLTKRQFHWEASPSNIHNP